MEEAPRRTSLVPLAFPCFLHCLIGVETEGLLDYQGRAGDHFHCAVEPSPGHIRRRDLSILDDPSIMLQVIINSCSSSACVVDLNWHRLTGSVEHAASASLLM